MSKSQFEYNYANAIGIMLLKQIITVKILCTEIYTCDIFLYKKDIKTYQLLIHQERSNS